MNILIALLIFSLIIIIHELGHFLLAKKNGIFVTEFSLGMGPRIISFVPTNKGYRFKGLLTQGNLSSTKEWQENTVYSIKLLPFGGSCMMLGEDDNIEDERAFNKKSVFARISVVFAGAFFNFILAFILALIVIGVIGIDPPTVLEVAKDSPLEKSGIIEGDLITSINGERISISREVSAYFTFNPISDQEIEITYEREGVKDTASLLPEYVETYMLGFSYTPDSSPAVIQRLYEDYPLHKAGVQIEDIITKVNGVTIESGKDLGEYFEANPLTKDEIEITYRRDQEEYTALLTPILEGGYVSGLNLNYGREKTTPFNIIKYSLIEIRYYIVSTVKSLGKFITGKIGANEIAGPVGIVNIIGDTYEASKVDGAFYVFLNLANLTILLSANLGVMNLLPIPALDGGRLVFLIIEGVRGKPIPQEKEGFVHFIGLIALMMLMVFVLFNDIRRLF